MITFISVDYFYVITITVGYQWIILRYYYYGGLLPIILSLTTGSVITEDILQGDNWAIIGLLLTYEKIILP